MARRKENSESAPKELDKLGVRWTARLRARVFGSVAPLPFDPKPRPWQEAWASLCERHARTALAPENDWNRSDAVYGPPLAKLRQEAASGQPSAPEDPVYERLRGLLFLSEYPPRTVTAQIVQELLDYWTGRAGLAFTTRVYLAEPAWYASINVHDNARRLCVKQSVMVDRSRLIGGKERLFFRRAVLSAPRDQYEAALAIAGERAKTDMEIAAAFCRDPRPAQSLAERLLGLETEGKNLGLQSRPSLGPLLSGIFDADLLTRCAPHGFDYLNHTGAEHALNLVDNLGRAAAGPLLRLVHFLMLSADKDFVLRAALLADREHCIASQGALHPSLAALLKKLLAR